MALIGYLRGAGGGPTDWPGGAGGLLAGRDAELEALRDALGDVKRKHARLIEVTGGPGLGKTRLLAEFSRRAAERGFQVLSGQASEAGRRVPFGPLIDALDDHLADHPPAPDLDGLDLLQLIFPALAPSGEHLPRTIQPADHYRLQRAMRGLLESIAVPGLVLLLDDLHWADDASVILLTELIRRPPRAPVLLVLAHRQRQAPAQLRAATSGAGAGLPVRQLELSVLSEEEAAFVLGTHGTQSWRSAVYRQSGGNPFYLDALARASLRSPASGGQPLSWSGQYRQPASDHGDGAVRRAEELPVAVQMALQVELEATSPLARLVARAAAVAGERFAVEFVAEIAERPEADVLAAVDELVSRDLIRQLDDRQRFGFRHAFVREATYASASPGWRLAAHARAAEALRQWGAPPADRADHVELSARPGDLAAVEILEEAAQAVWLQAPATAAHWLRAAARLLPHDGTTNQRRMSLLIQLARALGAAGHIQESRDAVHAALPLFSSEQAGQRAGVVAFCALMERLLGRHEEAEALLRDELAAIEGQDTVARASLLFELACGRLRATDSAVSVETAEEALAVARRHGNRPLQTVSLGLIAMARAAVGETDAARTQLDEATELLDAMVDEEFSASLDAALWVSWAEVLLERWDDALRHFDRALIFARGSGRDLILSHLLVGRVLILRATGRLADAMACAEDAVDLARLSSSDEQVVSAFSMQSWVAAWTGQLDERLVTGSAALEQASDGVNRSCPTLAARMLAEARLGMGDAEGCLALVDVAGGPGLFSAEACSRIGWYELMTRAELASGNVDGATQWAERAEASAAQHNLPGRTGLARLARAEVMAAGDPRTAMEPATAAVEALEESGMVVDAVRARMIVASAWAAAGEVDRASAELKSVQSAFESFGAKALVRQAMAERRRLAARTSRRRFTAPAEGLAALTRRERQVATLVSEGLTNRVIAQQLFVTEKTVEMHLANIFAKLGVSSRASVASVVSRSVGA